MDSSQKEANRIVSHTHSKHEENKTEQARTRTQANSETNPERRKALVCFNCGSKDTNQQHVLAKIRE
ncbi:unnamed protein product [Acanthoscelides obtectus]|uniref:Uncharacterized protein n=1 Tax=Acanthoscelides obtectus TaxID=200917 RepID=A0A9P0PRK5_ACAOB|nr:unnamed protein product [Acanthoscelides obtectus]CAK1687775.1 hypothetical protein AOBTE_LOCUS36360 [Acanthoscelides obtectus]